MTTELLTAATEKSNEIVTLRQIESRLQPCGNHRPDDAACLLNLPGSVAGDAVVIMAFIRDIYRKRREEAEAEFSAL